MSAARRFAPIVVVLVAFVAAVAGCGDPTSTPDGTSRDARYAQRAATTGVSVTATSPSDAPRDTTLNVQITGSGFDNGSVAEFTLNGALDARVRVNSTRYVKSTQLVANLTIAADAVSDLYDVAVMTAAGKKGIGTELFTVDVRKADYTAQARYSFAEVVNVGTADAPNWVPAGMRGDDRARDGSSTPGSNEYEGHFCGVNAVIGSGTGSQSADFNYGPAMSWSTTMAAACGSSRYYRVYLNGPDAAPGITTARQIVSGVSTMAVGDVRSVRFQSGTLADLGVGLWYDDAYPPASNVKVTRLADVPDPDGVPRMLRQWRVESQGTHQAMGMIQSTSKKGGSGTVPDKPYYVPFVMTVTEVPYPYPSFP